MVGFWSDSGRLSRVGIAALGAVGGLTPPIASLATSTDTELSFNILTEAAIVGAALNMFIGAVAASVVSKASVRHALIAGIAAPSVIFGIQKGFDVSSLLNPPSTSLPEPPRQEIAAPPGTQPDVGPGGGLALSVDPRVLRDVPLATVRPEPARPDPVVVVPRFDGPAPTEPVFIRDPTRLSPGGEAAVLGVLEDGRPLSIPESLREVIIDGASYPLPAEGGRVELLVRTTPERLSDVLWMFGGERRFVIESVNLD